MNPQLKKHDWIRIGNKNALVTRIYENAIIPSIEIIYLDWTKAINEDVHRVNNQREFVIEGVAGGYADKYDRLRESVNILRRGC